MSKILRDIWIMVETGVVLYKRVFDEKINEQLFGSMMSALNIFAGEISSGTLKHFELGNIKFSIKEHNNLLFVVNSDLKVKQKKINNVLDEITEKFTKLYGSHVFSDFDGEVTLFESFNKEISDTFQDPIKKFENAFW